MFTLILFEKFAFSRNTLLKFSKFKSPLNVNMKISIFVLMSSPLRDRLIISFIRSDSFSLKLVADPDGSSFKKSLKYWLILLNSSASELICTHDVLSYKIEEKTNTFHYQFNSNLYTFKLKIIKIFFNNFI